MIVRVIGFSLLVRDDIAAIVDSDTDLLATERRLAPPDAGGILLERADRGVAVRFQPALGLGLGKTVRSGQRRILVGRCIGRRCGAVVDVCASAPTVVMAQNSDVRITRFMNISIGLDGYVPVRR